VWYVCLLLCLAQCVGTCWELARSDCDVALQGQAALFAQNRLLRKVLVPHSSLCARLLLIQLLDVYDLKPRRSFNRSATCVSFCATMNTRRSARRWHDLTVARCVPITRCVSITSLCVVARTFPITRPCTVQHRSATADSMQRVFLLENHVWLGHIGKLAAVSV